MMSHWYLRKAIVCGTRDQKQLNVIIRNLEKFERRCTVQMLILAKKTLVFANTHLT